MVDKNECQELKNIKYKTMLLQGNNSETAPTIPDSITNLDDFLEKECKNSKFEPWSKLDKSMKLKCLYEYGDKLSSELNLSPHEKKILKVYLSVSLDKKKFQRIKDVQYDKEEGKIINISNLIFNKSTKKFTLKKDQKHVSTLKSLAPTKKGSLKNKNIKEKDSKKSKKVLKPTKADKIDIV